MFQNKHSLQMRNTEIQLAEMFDVLDELHTAASENQLSTLTSLNRRELVAWLRDLVYTAEETIAEIEQDNAQPRKSWHEPILRLVEKGEADARRSGGAYAINE